MNNLDRELEELTGAATRYVVTPPASTIRHRAAVRRRTRAATATAGALAIAGAVTAVFVLGPQDKANNLPPVQPATSAPTTTGPVMTDPGFFPSPAGTEAATPTETPASSVEVSSPVATTSPDSAAASFPPFAKDLTHGGKTWAVFLVVSKDGSDPRYATARDQLTAAGYPGFDGEARERPAGDLGCDAGAQQGLAAAGIAFEPGVYYTGMAVYFDTKAEAEAFVAAYEPGIVGTVQVTYMCAD